MRADKKARVYFSVPLTLSMNDVKEYEKKFKGKKTLINYWDRKWGYNEKVFDAADAVVIFTPNNKFNFSDSILPTGVRAELREAIAQDKNIYMAYRTASNEYNIYEVDYSIIDGKIHVSGISGTKKDYDSLYEHIEDTTDIGLLPKARKVESKSIEVSPMGSPLGKIMYVDYQFNGMQPDRRLLLIG